MSGRDLSKKPITKEELEKFYQTSTGRRAVLLSSALEEELAAWDLKKRDIEQELRNCQHLLDWVRSQKPDVINTLSVKYQELENINKKFFRFLFKKNKLKSQIKESEEYLESLNKRGEELVKQINELDDKYFSHINSGPDVTAYEFGIYGKNLFKPRY